MGKEILNKELVENLLKIKGETRGFTLRYDGEYVLKSQGEAGLKKLEKELDSLGCPIEYKAIRATGFFPVGMRAISLLAMKKMFDFDNEKIREIGAFHPKFPMGIRLFVKYIYSPYEILKTAQRMWRIYYTIGEVSITDYNEKENYALFEIRNFDIHPIVCRVIEGHIAYLARMAIKASEATCRELKCTFEGEAFHQFKVIWEE